MGDLIQALPGHVSAPVGPARGHVSAPALVRVRAGWGRAGGQRDAGCAPMMREEASNHGQPSVDSAMRARRIEIKGVEDGSLNSRGQVDSTMRAKVADFGLSTRRSLHPHVPCCTHV